METKHITNTVHDSKISLSNNAEAEKILLSQKLNENIVARISLESMYLNSVELII